MTKKKKVQPPKRDSSTLLDVPPFHICFPITLHHKSENKFCYFADDFHLKKYLMRCNLKPKDVKITQTVPRQ